MNKKLLGLFTAFVMAVTVFAVPTSASFAKEGSTFKLDTKKITFSKSNCNDYDYIGTTSKSSEYIKSASSSKKSVATVYVEYADVETPFVVVTPKKTGKAGSTTIKVKSNKGNVRTIKVKVKKNYFKANLKEDTFADIVPKHRAVTVYSWPKAKVKIKIGGKTYTKKCNKNGTAKIKLKKGGYPKGTKYKIIAKKGKIKCTKKGKVIDGAG